MKKPWKRIKKFIFKGVKSVFKNVSSTSTSSCPSDFPYWYYSSSMFQNDQNLAVVHTDGCIQHKVPKRESQNHDVSFVVNGKEAQEYEAKEGNGLSLREAYDLIEGRSDRVVEIHEDVNEKTEKFIKKIKEQIVYNQMAQRSDSVVEFEDVDEKAEEFINKMKEGLHIEGKY